MPKLWPCILCGEYAAEDPEYPVTETRPGPRTVSVPRLRARPITTEGTFALCKTITDAGRAALAQIDAPDAGREP